MLDEATSSLDLREECKALDQLTQNKTTVVIAHRLSTILNSYKIHVVDKGKIIDSGKHELILKSSVYKNFYDRQVKKLMYFVYNLFTNLIFLLSPIILFFRIL